MAARSRTPTNERSPSLSSARLERMATLIEAGDTAAPSPTPADTPAIPIEERGRFQRPDGTTDWGAWSNAMSEEERDDPQVAPASQEPTGGEHRGMQEVEEVPQVSLAAHQALLAARERELRRAWSRQRAYDLGTDAMRQLSHASNLVERVFHTPAEAEHPSGGPWREGITFQERGVAEMVEAQLNIVIELLNTLLGSLARSEQEVFDASFAAATASHLNCEPSAWHESAL